MMDKYVYVYIYIAWFQHWNGSAAPPSAIANSPVVYVSLTEARAPGQPAILSCSLFSMSRFEFRRETSKWETSFESSIFVRKRAPTVRGLVRGCLQHILST